MSRIGTSDLLKCAELALSNRQQHRLISSPEKLESTSGQREVAKMLIASILAKTGCHMMSHPVLAKINAINILAKTCSVTFR